MKTRRVIGVATIVAVIALVLLVVRILPNIIVMASNAFILPFLALILLVVFVFAIYLVLRWSFAKNEL